MCQNAHLSMETAGQAFKCFVIDQPSTSVMEHKQVNFLQGVLASYVELDEWRAELNQKDRRRVRGLQTLHDEAAAPVARGAQREGLTEDAGAADVQR